MNIVSPNGFLKMIGIVLLLLSVLGMIGILGPTSSQSIFEGNWWLDQLQITAYCIVGFAALFAAFLFPPLWQRYLSILFGLFVIVIGLSGFINPIFFGVHLELTDTILDVMIGLWAIFAAYGVAIKR